MPSYAPQCANAMIYEDLSDLLGDGYNPAVEVRVYEETGEIGPTRMTTIGQLQAQVDDATDLPSDTSSYLELAYLVASKASALSHGYIPPGRRYAAVLALTGMVEDLLTVTEDDRS